jgi:DNA polymerase-1
MPKKRGEDRTTTEAKHLKRFAKRHPVFRTILDCREKKTAISRYIYQVNAEGHVTTQYGFHPSTWRKSSRNDNLQNIPIRNHELAEAIRGTMVASPGHVLVEADYEGIEAVIVGVLAGDPSYIRICKASLHGYMAARRMGTPIDPNLPFAELRRQCKAIKKNFPKEYDDAKRGNHGVNYLLSPYGLVDEHPETFPTQKAAKDYIELYFSEFAPIRRWHQNVLRLASRQTYLDNHFGVRHYFYNVLNWDPTTRDYTKLGDDAKRAVAFIPQSDGSCIQNADLIQLAADPIIEPLLRLVIHDSKVLHVPLELVDYVCGQLHQIMSKPRVELGGEAIGVEIAIGTDLRKSNMDTWHPPTSGLTPAPEVDRVGGNGHVTTGK